MPTDASKLCEALIEADRLLWIARDAGVKMGLHERANDLRLPHEVRMFAAELASGEERGGAFFRARQLIKSVYPREAPNG